MDDDAIADHAMMLVREGLYSKAAAALERAEPAPADAATHAALTALNPDGAATGPMPATPVPPPLVSPLDPASFLAVFSSPPRGSAPGPTG